MPPRPSWLLPLVTVLVAALCVGGVMLGRRHLEGAEAVRAAPPGRSAPPAVTPAAVRDPAVRLLAEWDRRRARAYATGDVRRLRDLYVPGSRAGAADVALLAAYVERGLAVQGMRMQVLAARTLVQREGLLRLRVTDRLVGAEAMRAGRVTPLPSDSPSTRVVSLVLGDDGGWRVSTVRAARDG